MVPSSQNTRLCRNCALFRPTVNRASGTKTWQHIATIISHNLIVNIFQRIELTIIEFISMSIFTVFP